MVIINEVVALFAGLIPVPGGVGVTEGALTAGFVAVGVPEDIAFSAALCYRMCTFYLPPIWGYPCFSALQRDGLPVTAAGCVLASRMARPGRGHDAIPG